MKKTLIFWLIAASFAFSKEKYELKCPQSLIDASLDSAISQVGVIERSNRNDGKDIRRYLSLFNLPEGSPYCAAGVYWSFFVSARALSLPDSVIPIAKTPLANGIFNSAKIDGVKTPFIARKNDLIIWRKRKSAFGHIERIIATCEGGWVKTIAFNSSQIQSDGKKVEGVFIQRRNINHPLGRLLIRGLVGFLAK